MEKTHQPHQVLVSILFAAKAALLAGGLIAPAGHAIDSTCENTREVNEDVSLPDCLTRVVLVDYNPWEQTKDYFLPDNAGDDSQLRAGQENQDTPNETRKPLDDSSRRLNLVSLGMTGLFAYTWNKIVGANRRGERLATRPDLSWIDVPVPDEQVSMLHRDEKPVERYNPMFGTDHKKVIK